MKNMKLITRLGIGFLVMDAVLVWSLYTGYTSVKQMMNAEDPERYLSSFGTFTAIEFVIMLIVSTGVIVTMLSIIRGGLNTIKGAAKELAVGNVDVELVKKNNDEIGEVIDEFQKVVDNVRYQADIAAEVASGNMMVEVVPKSDADVMGQALKKMVDQNQHALGNIKDAAYQVTTSASQVASASEALAQGSTEQASAIEQITASIDDVAEKTKQNAQQANTAADLMGQTIADVQRSNTEMQEMIAAMGDINKSSESIAKIIKVIDDIAFQTNILALNAAVEAARAGEAGKGFAVVAEEVRNLAAKSAAAAAETAELIEDSIHKVAVGTKIANETEKALEELSEVARKSETLVNEIAESSSYQATAIAQIDQAIEQVSQVVQTNSATSEECAAASVELSDQAGRMREMIALYKLDNTTATGTDYKNTKSRASVDKNEQIISLKDGFGKY